MASVSMDGKKCKHTTKQACSGTIKHDYRENKNYSNADIDLSRSHLNQTFGCKTGDEARRKLRKRIAECDLLHPPKRIKEDRKTNIGISIPAPRDQLPDELLRIFFSKAYTSMEDLFGTENVIYGVVHYDEIHKYIDAETKEKKESRAGLHIMVTPWTDGMSFVPEKYKAGLNMRNFYRRSLPNLINKQLDIVCQEVFGFPYRDGSKKKGTKVVEELKEESREIENNIRLLVQQEEQKESNQAWIDRTDKMIADNTKSLASLQKEREMLVELQREIVDLVDWKDTSVSDRTPRKAVYLLRKKEKELTNRERKVQKQEEENMIRTKELIQERNELDQEKYLLKKDKEEYKDLMNQQNEKLMEYREQIHDAKRKAELSKLLEDAGVTIKNILEYKDNLIAINEDSDVEEIETITTVLDALNDVITKEGLQ